MADNRSNGGVVWQARSTINEHILNAYKENEIEEAKTMRKIGNSDFSTKPTNYYNLDVINGDELLEWAGSVSHEEAMNKALIEYRKFQVKTLSPVEQDYLESIKLIEKKTKKKGSNE